MRTSVRFLAGLSGMFLTGFLVLAVTLWRVQITNVGTWREAHQTQATRRIRTSGLRGRILDREGRILADCRPSRNVMMHPEAFKGGDPETRAENAYKALTKLKDFLALEPCASERTVLSHMLRASALPLAVFKDLDDGALAKFEENAFLHPGFSIETSAEREYPFGRLACHTIGYVGRDMPSQDRYEQSSRYHFLERELKGRSGIEAYYDDYLAGAPGERHVNVDALGYARSASGDERLRAPTDGPDLRLTLDARIQRALERELEGEVGAGVVLDPRDGAVLAIASSPSYDLNDLVPSMSHEVYASLTNNPAKPLINRAISGLYEPGSTFKPITAMAASVAGVPPTATYVCTGVYRKTHCMNRWGHGELALRSALEHSCNPFFLHLADVAGTNVVCATAKEFGLGSRTGIDLRGEASGSVDPWMMQAAIGQGQLQVTPLQMAVVTMALANGGFIFRPYLHHLEEWQPKPMPVHALEFDDHTYQLVRLGMRDVVETGSGKRILTRFDENGTKHPLNVKCAGKTGTAERGIGANKRKNAWVIAFAPFDNPTVAVALVIEQGDSGGLTAGPKVHNILRAVFGEKGDAT